MVFRAILTDSPVPEDQEMLELALLTSVPSHQRVTLARLLLSRFGSFAGVISAPITQLMSVEGLSIAVAAALKLVQISARQLVKGQVLDRPLISNSDHLQRYLATFAYENTEHLRILFLNSRNFLLADEEHSRGTVNFTHAYPREIIKRTFELHATAFIMVHNHPSGDPTPSELDIAMTRDVQNAAKVFDITLQDHIIIAGTNWLSFRDFGLL